MWHPVEGRGPGDMPPEYEEPRLQRCERYPACPNDVEDAHVDSEGHAHCSRACLLLDAAEGEVA